MADIYQLEATADMTVTDCLEYCKVEQLTNNEYDGVLVIAWPAEGDHLVVRSSKLSNKDALWILMKAIDYVRGIE